MITYFFFFLDSHSPKELILSRALWISEVSRILIFVAVGGLRNLVWYMIITKYNKNPTNTQYIPIYCLLVFLMLQKKKNYLCLFVCNVADISLKSFYYGIVNPPSSIPRYNEGLLHWFGMYSWFNLLLQKCVQSDTNRWNEDSAGKFWVWAIHHQQAVIIQEGGNIIASFLWIPQTEN